MRCTVELVGIPASQLPYHQLRLGGRSAKASARVSFEVAHAGTVRLTGPRYGGTWLVSARTCGGGTIRAVAKPLPARINFGCPPHGAVVRCVGCGEDVDGKPHLPDAFPSFETAAFRSEVRLDFAAPGFVPLRMRVVVHPGVNEVTAHMRRR